MPVTAITLVCNPAAPVIDDSLVDAAIARLETLGRVERRILSVGVAEDFVIAAELSRARAQSLLGPALGAAPVDVIVQPAAHRRRRLLIADMDSTIIGQECIDELADLGGVKTQISAITEKAMRGEIDFEKALVERVAMLKGLPESALDETFRRRITLNPGAKTLVGTMNKMGAATVLVSGGFTFFVERVARLAGFQFFQANELVIKGGKLTGDVARPILGRGAKQTAVRRYAAQIDLQLDETLAVGDGANDIEMISTAGLGVAYRAKPALAAVADAAIAHADLTALLYAQGIAREEFAESA